MSALGSEDTDRDKKNSPRQLGHKKKYTKKMNSKPVQKVDEHKELTQRFQFQIQTFTQNFGEYSNKNIRQKFITDRDVQNNTASLSSKHSPLFIKNNQELRENQNSSINYEVGSQSTVGNT